MAGSRVRVALALPALALAFALLQPAGASAWAPPGKASIHPGVQTRTAGAQCTANFVFKRKLRRGRAVFIGQAAHCAGTGPPDEIDGCRAKTLRRGQRVNIDGARRAGRLAYSSWLAMQRSGERRRNVCEHNDFALVRINRRDVRRVNPSVPVFGGPRGIGTAAPGERIFTYGNSSLRGGSRTLAAKTGYVIDRNRGGWNYDLYTLTPGIPGDSGSGFLNSGGRAFGVLSTVALLPLPASNGVGDLQKAVRYARRHGMRGLRLVRGTVAFEPTVAGPVR